MTDRTHLTLFSLTLTGQFVPVATLAAVYSECPLSGEGYFETERGTYVYAPSFGYITPDGEAVEALQHHEATCPPFRKLGYGADAMVAFVR